MSTGLAPGRRKRHLNLACLWDNWYLAYRTRPAWRHSQRGDTASRAWLACTPPVAGQIIFPSASSRLVGTYSW